MKYVNKEMIFFSWYSVQNMSTCIILVNLIINMQFHPKKDEDKYWDWEYCFLRVISPITRAFQ